MIDTLSIRCNILRLAFSGKLSEQIESDGTVFDLLQQISKKPVTIQTQGVPYQIPDSWGWVRLCDVYSINPKVVAADDSKAAFIPMERISAGFGQDFSYEVQNWSQASKNHTKFENDDVAFAKISPCFENRKSFIARNLPNGIGGGTTELIILRQRFILPEYTYYLIQDQRFISAGATKYKGTVGQQRIQSDMVKNYLIPLAPYSEQKRIVEKIEQTFSVLDTIDTLQSKYSDNFAVLKAKLIDAAIQGKLTQQLPEDGTAEELYQQMHVEKQNLIKLGRIKKERTLPAIEDKEIPFAIPKNWIWVRFCDLYSLSNGVASRGSLGGKPHPVLRLADLTDNGIDLSAIREIYLTDSEYLSHKIQKDDLVFIRVNGSRNKVANAYLYSGEKDISFCDHLFCGHKLSALIIPSYIMLVYNSAFVKKQVDPEIKTTAGQNTINQKSMSMIKLPLPPILEQKRIVEKLGELLNLIEMGN